MNGELAIRIDNLAATATSQTLPNQKIDIVRIEADAAIAVRGLDTPGVITAGRGEKLGVWASNTTTRHTFNWKRTTAPDIIRNGGVGACPGTEDVASHRGIGPYST